MTTLTTVIFYNEKNEELFRINRNTFHPRVGEFVNYGKILYKVDNVFLNYDAGAVQISLEICKVMLGLRRPPVDPIVNHMPLG